MKLFLKSEIETAIYDRVIRDILGGGGQSVTHTFLHFETLL